MPLYRRFPVDDEFMRKIQERNLYTFRSRNYLFRRFENHGRKESLSVDDYTIEHIMPQSELSSAWQASLGEDWLSVHKTYLHTLGNLTLTGYNSEYSNRPFNEKRDMRGGFRDSPLKVNAGLRGLLDWNENAIKARAEKLAGQALAVWPAPVVQSDMLAEYRPELAEDAKGKYSIEDHPNLLSSPTRELLQAFRDEVLRLDPRVTEEYLKVKVAYKAPTNFADVVPQAKRLKVTLNMGFSEVDDPLKMCRDVSGLGTWGTGEVQLEFSDIDELSHVIDLVRQSLGLQLGWW